MKMFNSLFNAMRGLCLAAILLVGAGFAPSVFAASNAESCPALLNNTFPRLQDEVPQNLCQYKGKVILVVNTASRCGNTPQYDGLEKLSAKYGSKGLVVIGFPSNDFGKQEQGSNAEIAEFCRTTYGVKFPMMSKTTVVGNDANRFFKALTKTTGSAPEWNFHKYLIDRTGAVVESYSARTQPDDAKLVQAIEAKLSN
jgi:glutathione peroxidase